MDGWLLLFDGCDDGWMDGSGWLLLKTLDAKCNTRKFVMLVGRMMSVHYRLLMVLSEKRYHRLIVV
jgi:hypothetical protein